MSASSQERILTKRKLTHPHDEERRYKSISVNDNRVPALLESLPPRVPSQSQALPRRGRGLQRSTGLNQTPRFKSDTQINLV